MELNLDIRTLCVVTAMLSIVYFIGLSLLQKNQEPIPGLFTLATAILMLSIGFSLLSFGPSISIWLSKVAANTLIAFGFTLIVHSLCQFRITSFIYSKIAFILLPLVAISLIYYSLFDTSTTTRIVIISLHVVICTSMSAYITLKGKADDLSLAIWLLAGIFFFNAFFMTLRIGITVSGSDINNFLHAGNIHQLAFFMMVVLIIVVGFTFTWLINARLVSTVYSSSIKDSLTQLYNRRAMEDIIPREYSRAQRNHSELSIIIADIDHFKEINDSLGHQIGDLVLIRIGEILRTKLRKQDLGFRYGGDEFLIILPETNTENAMIVANKIRESIASFSFTQNQTVPWTASFGVSQLNKDEQWSSLIQRADEALYAAKSNGRNAVYSAKTPSDLGPNLKVIQ
ncbi:GGDEF domain-containing protein [Vibrio gallaecicus]|uniref:GGDEF domain-containing protein n=1 Tax=Vibrio gallaecicus TaxID=552386 RepID=UPI0010C9C0BF|nr:GGDEF domain-containing protein [Vibrio gallaecicus]MDN3616472.1 GGDEF domain-containing protein [Vibrio gallaecicus]